MLVLVDLSNVMHMYNHVYKDLSCIIEGIKFPTGSVYGVLNLVQSMLLSGEVSEIIFCIDNRSEERSILSESYKANRGGSSTKDVFSDAMYYIYLIASMVSNVSFAQKVHKEADDVIASLALSNIKTRDVLIYSNDKDFYQLAHKGIKQSSHFKNGKFLLVTEEVIKEKLNHNNLNSVLPFRAIKGDRSDNIDPVCPRLNTVVASWVANVINSHYPNFDVVLPILQGYLEGANVSSDVDTITTVGVKRSIFIKHLEMFLDSFSIFKNNLALMDLLKYENNPIAVDITRSLVDASVHIDLLGLVKFKAFINSRINRGLVDA